MTTDLIALAKQAGAICTPVHFSRCIAEFDNQALQAFADLIAQREREQCAKLLDVRPPGDENLGQERHRLHFAAAIRARGTT